MSAEPDHEADADADNNRLDVIRKHPIANGLDAFRSSTTASLEKLLLTSIHSQDLGREDAQDITLNLLSALLALPASRLPRSKASTIRNDLARLISIATSDIFDFDRFKPLIDASLADELQDAPIWHQVEKAVAEYTPPPQPTLASLQTPWRYSTGALVNSSEKRRDVDQVLKMELGPLQVDILKFHAAFFGSVEGLQGAAQDVFQRCTRDDPLFRDGWQGWPTDANQDAVLAWFADITAKLAALAQSRHRDIGRRLLAQPSKPIAGSTGERKLDIGFVDDPDARKDARYHWSQILVPGELKSNPAADTAAKAWLDLGRYAREVLAAQDTRRFVLGFTLCGSVMRVWEFDRLGGMASESFDINKEGERFVTTVLGFLWMSEKELGFDPTIVKDGDKRYFTIERPDQREQRNQTERIYLNKVIRRARCVAGRATTCWRAYSDKDPNMSLVVKDSWQYTERAEEGEMLLEATRKGVVHIARYYHHATVLVDGKEDDVVTNIRHQMKPPEPQIRPAGPLNPRRGRPRKAAPTSSAVATPSQSRSSSLGMKRPSSDTDLPAPPSKRLHSSSPTKSSADTVQNRVHRRVIVEDCGDPIYKATSPATLLAALRDCVEGHESVLRAGYLHRDMSINNLMFKSGEGFLIDFDLAIELEGDGPSGAKEKTGTRAFMAIGALKGLGHTFMYDLESIFWILFWICIHFDGPEKDIGATTFDAWNYEPDDKLVSLKLGTVADEDTFLETGEKYFTPYYMSLLPLVNRLRKTIFPDGIPWKKENMGLYSSVKEILATGEREMQLLMRRQAPRD